MAMTNKPPFPLCAAAGLKVALAESPWVHASDVERMLESAQVVYSARSAQGIKYDSWFNNETYTSEDCARLVCIQPLKAPDSAESLLRELVDRVCNDDSRQTVDVAIEIAKRARALLEGEK